MWINQSPMNTEDERWLKTLPIIKRYETQMAELRQNLSNACDRLRDMLEGDDGQAWDEARKFLRLIGEPTSIQEKRERTTK